MIEMLEQKKINFLQISQTSKFLKQKQTEHIFIISQLELIIHVNECVRFQNGLRRYFKKTGVFKTKITCIRCQKSEAKILDKLLYTL